MHDTQAAGCNQACINVGWSSLCQVMGCSTSLNSQITFPLLAPIHDQELLKVRSLLAARPRCWGPGLWLGWLWG